MRIVAPHLQHAAHLLAQVLEFRAPADATAKRYFRANPRLGARDRAFIAETVFGCLRRLRQAEHHAGDRRPLHLVLAHLLHACGIPAASLRPALRHPEEVEWLDAPGHARRAPTPLPLGMAAELPDWTIDRLRTAMNDDQILALGRALQEPAPLDLRINPLVTTRGDVRARLATDGIEAEPTAFSPLGLRLRAKQDLTRHPLFLEGRIEVQDEGSQLLGFLVDAKAGECVIDLCAGAGGKTLLLGALMRSKGRLYACDISARRLENLAPRLKRSGLSNVHPLLLQDGSDPHLKRLHGKADRVLVDAPCTGLGTARRNPDLKWCQGLRAVAELATKQSSILDRALHLVKPGGRVVYATCSFLREENDDVIERALHAHPDFTLGNATEALAAQDIALDTGACLRLSPATHGTDGFFGAILTRSAG